MNNVIIKDLDRPSWFMRVGSITEAKEYIDSVDLNSRSMSATSPDYYAQYDQFGNWVVIDRNDNTVISFDDRKEVFANTYYVIEFKYIFCNQYVRWIEECDEYGVIKFSSVKSALQYAESHHISEFRIIEHVERVDVVYTKELINGV